MFLSSQKPEITLFFQMNQRHILPGAQQFCHGINPFQPHTEIINSFRFHKYIPRKQPAGDQCPLPLVFLPSASNQMETPCIQTLRKQACNKIFCMLFSPILYMDNTPHMAIPHLSISRSCYQTTTTSCQSSFIVTPKRSLCAIFPTIVYLLQLFPPNALILLHIPFLSALLKAVSFRIPPPGFHHQTASSIRLIHFLNVWLSTPSCLAASLPEILSFFHISYIISKNEGTSIGFLPQ